MVSTDLTESLTSSAQTRVSFLGWQWSENNCQWKKKEKKKKFLSMFRLKQLYQSKLYFPHETGTAAAVQRAAPLQGVGSSERQSSLLPSGPITDKRASDWHRQHRAARSGGVDQTENRCASSPPFRWPSQQPWTGSTALGLVHALSKHTKTLRLLYTTLHFYKNPPLCDRQGPFSLGTVW